MLLSVVQNDPMYGEKKENIQQCLSMMETVRADLYVLPELFATGYNFIDKGEVHELAETYDDGSTFAELEKYCRKKRCFVIFGFAEREGGKLYNSAALLGFNGMKGLYRKVHLFDREKLFFEPGNMGFQVFDVPFGKIGLMICFDWYFPESARTLALMGAQLIAHPSNLVLPNCPDSMPTRSLENRVYTATANRIGTEDRGGHSLTYIGKSQITTPYGKILCRLAEKEAEVAVEEIDLSLASDKNLAGMNNLFKDRRPDMYILNTLK